VRIIVALPLLDRSYYYKSLLILIRRDRTIDSRERELMMRIGKMLDFDPRFCEAAIEDVLRNRHIRDEPVIFPDRRIAECFLHDGLRLALVDEEMHPQELSWLKTVARSNHLETGWLDAEVERLRLSREEPGETRPLDIQQYL
jgi:hypothetical protein